MFKRFFRISTRNYICLAQFQKIKNVLLVELLNLLQNLINKVDVRMDLIIVVKRVVKNTLLNQNKWKRRERVSERGEQHHIGKNIINNKVEHITLDQMLKLDD